MNEMSRDFEPDDEERVSRNIDPWKTFSPTQWRDGQQKPVPWLVKGLFVKGTVGMISSDGGLGKSLLAQQLLTAGANGLPWLGYQMPKVRTYGLFCEDTIDSLERRQNDINAHYGLTMSDLEDMCIIERVAKNNLMFNFERSSWSLKTTQLWKQFRDDVCDFGPSLVVIDHVREVFGGNEIDAQQIAEFVRSLRRLAVKIDGTIVVLAHVSNEGLKEGSGLAGNRAWNNSVRSRFFLTEKKQAEGEEGPNNGRMLRTMKNNEGAYGMKIQLLWDHGVLVRQDDQDADGPEISSEARKVQVDQAVLERINFLATTGQRMSPDEQERNSVVKLVRNDPSMKGYTPQEIRFSKDRLLHKKRIAIVSMDVKGKLVSTIRPLGFQYVEEREATRQAALDLSKG